MQVDVTIKLEFQNARSVQLAFRSQRTRARFAWEAPKAFLSASRIMERDAEQTSFALPQKDSGSSALIPQSPGSDVQYFDDSDSFY